MSGERRRAPRAPFDVDTYVRRVREGPCFICRLVAGDPELQHPIVYEDREHVAFLSRYPTLPAYTLVAPKAHVEHVVRDLSPEAYTRLMAVVRRVALGIEAAVPSERTYLLSLGSQQGNAHLHWHVVPLPPGTPYEEQQLHALMAEDGVLDLPPAETSSLADRLRRAIEAMPS